MIYVTRDGDVIDAICWRVFGRTAGVVEEVLALNPGLGFFPEVLPAGVSIVLPSSPAVPAPKRELSLWD